VNIVRIWLLMLAAIAVAVPLRAADMNAPVPLWRNTVAAETATVNWSRVAMDAQDAAQEETHGVAQGAMQDLAQNQVQQTLPGGPADPSTAASSPEIIIKQPVQDDQRAKAEKQLKEQEHQRVLGVLPSFNVSYRSDAVSLTKGEKIRLAFRSSIDPVTFGTAFLVAGYHEAANDVGFGWGVKGYAQRTGAAYLDSFDGNMLGNGILPALLHQDPRYFRLGHGSTTHRLLYAAAAAFICKHDNTGKWEPNYSNVMGNVAAGAISNLYYPGGNSGVGLTISNGMIVTAEGAFGSIFQEFWPDISRKLFHKDPTNGRDAQASATGNSR
jgi:hypothetical protein